MAQPNYYPFGEEITTTGNQQTIDDKKFTGHQRDTLGTAGVADDIDYMHARFYSPLLGRFLSADPVLGRTRAPQSWNRYSYVQNNPVLLTDPTGLQEKPKTPTADKGLRDIIHDWFAAHFSQWFPPPAAGENDPNAQALAEEYGEAKEHPRNLAGNVQEGLNEAGTEISTATTVVAIEAAVPAALSRAARVLSPGGRLIGSAGSRSTIRELSGGSEAALNLFSRLAKGGERVTNTGYPGVLVRLADDAYVGYRSVSRSGLPTIEVNIPGLAITKIHFLN